MISTVRGEIRTPRRTSRWGLGAIALLLALGAGPGGAESALAGPPRIVRDDPYPPMFQKEVRDAIQRGLTYLRTTQMKDPSGLLTHPPDEFHAEMAYKEGAAVLWVLKRAGLPAADDAMREARERLNAPGPKTVDEAALALMALCAAPLEQADPFGVRAEAASPKLEEMSEVDRALVTRAAKFLLERQIKSSDRTRTLWTRRCPGGWASGHGAQFGCSDVPTTYMALLGLEAASRCGLDVPIQTYRSALSLLLSCQAEKGPRTTLQCNEVRGGTRRTWTEAAQARGFGFSEALAKEATGYFTAAAVVAMMICQDALESDPTFQTESRTKTADALRDALAWIQKNYDVRRNPGDSGHASGDEDDVYLHDWLQALARLSIHARIRFFGRHDWYLDGAKALIRTQKAEGNWDYIWWDNCYPILFLERASLVSAVPVVTPTER